METIVASWEKHSCAEGTAYPCHYFVSVPMFTTGFSSGVSDVSSARGGRGGSTTGYGSSGEGFSGSGSWSIF